MFGIKHKQDSFKMTIDAKCVDPDLAAGISSQNGPVVDQGNL